MSSHTFQFIIYCAFNAMCLVAGYTARRRLWVSEHLSRAIHFYTIVVIWSAVGLLSLWKLPHTFANLWLIALEPILVAVPAFLTIPIAKSLGAKRDHVGLLAVGAGLGNLGFTLGGYLCYTFITNPALLPGHHAASHAAVATAALAYAIAQVTIMATCGMAFLYPVARHFGQPHTTDESIHKLIFHSLVDVRAMPLYAAIVGVLFAYTHIPYPNQAIESSHLINVLFYLGGFGGYFGIGLRLHLGQSLNNLRHHALLAVMKFAFIPLLTLSLLFAVGFAPTPPPVLAQHTMMLLAMMPTAIQMVIIANLFHLDARFASSLWLVNTAVFLLVALPILLLVFA